MRLQLTRPCDGQSGWTDTNRIRRPAKFMPPDCINGRPLPTSFSLMDCGLCPSNEIGLHVVGPVPAAPDYWKKRMMAVRSS